MTRPAFARIDHRPWPLPSRPWMMRQSWLDLCFLHFPVDAAAVAASLPAGLEPDLHEGQAWIGLVPFRMEDVAPRFIPAIPGVSAFPEFNIRTYVTAGGKPGVWFYSLDVPNRLPVWAARTFFHLPYFRAEMTMKREGELFRYQVARDGKRFAAIYGGGAPAAAPQGSFEQWATERYCLYSASSAGKVYRGEVQHPPWPLQRGRIEITENSLCPIPLGAMHPSVLFSPRIDVVVWNLERVV